LTFFDNAMQKFGISCHTASNVVDALRLVDETGPYDIYFLDWKLPEVEGVELAR